MYALLMLATALITFLVAIAIFAGGALSGLATLALRALRPANQTRSLKAPTR